jgi:uncharacterized protein YdaU (DUF1376 family)
MAKEPWFKFFAADYLLDPAVDALPLEAQAVLLRMWCLCHIEGFCPADAEQIARKVRLPLEQITRHWQSLTPFFEVRGGKLYSFRMEEEKRKSEIARRAGNKRGEQIRSANRSADCSAQSQSQDQSQSQGQSHGQLESPSPSTERVFDLSLQKKNYSQTDFDERDLRRFADERKKVELKMANGWGSELTDEQIFDYICNRAGLTPNRVRDVFARIESEASAGSRLA